MYILRVDPKVTKKLLKVNFFNVQALKLNFPATPCITLAKAHLIESFYSAKRCFPHVLEQQITKIQKIIAGQKVCYHHKLVGLIIMRSNFCNLRTNFLVIFWVLNK